MTKEQFIKNLSVPSGIIDVILDTDAYNEIDDQFAISYMLKKPCRFNVLGITAAPFHNSRSTGPLDGMEKSYNEILKLLGLLGKTELYDKVYRGSKSYLYDEATPVKSEAAKFIADTAANYSPATPLYIVAIGAITNVASALLISPKIAENIVIVWLGGHATHYPNPADEFNMTQDIAAARVVFSAEAPLVQLPCLGAVHDFTISKYELIHWLSGFNPLCDYLAKATIEEADSYAFGKPWTRVIWDVTAVAWLINDGDRFMNSEIRESYMPRYDRSYAPSENPHKMRYVYHIKRNALMADLIETLRDKNQ